MTKGLIIAGTQSGAGKTTLTLGLMAALKRRGLEVAPFKVGPDFIDPGHHKTAAGRASRNLDGWMLSRAYNQTLFATHSAQADVVVVEGVMGLFDGFSGQSEAGSTAQMAKWLELPVLLVVDAASMARSAAALVQGFERFDADLQFAGVVFNNLGSKGHLEYLQQAMQGNVAMPVVGGLQRDHAMHMPERHLGLVTAEDNPLSNDRLDHLAEHIEDRLSLDTLLDQLPEMNRPPIDMDRPKPASQPAVRIGVAQDKAFCFYYPDNLDLLGVAGAEIVPFSPLNDAMPPDYLDGIYLGGGYPELHAADLTRNITMRAAIRQLSNNGMPIYGECGGFMYLCRDLTDHDGQTHAMCGCFGFQTRMNPKLRTLGYRQVRLTLDTLLGPRDTTLRGHEFHYSDIVSEEAGPAAGKVYRVTARKRGGPKQEGYAVRNTLGSYIHLHFGSQAQSANAFVNKCLEYQRRREQVK